MGSGVEYQDWRFKNVVNFLEDGRTASFLMNLVLICMKYPTVVISNQISNNYKAIAFSNYNNIVKTKDKFFM